MASYWLSENDNTLFVKEGLASNDMAIGVSSLEPIVLFVNVGVEAY